MIAKIHGCFPDDRDETIGWVGMLLLTAAFTVPLAGFSKGWWEFGNNGTWFAMLALAVGFVLSLFASVLDNEDRGWPWVLGLFAALAVGFVWSISGLPVVLTLLFWAMLPAGIIALVVAMALDRDDLMEGALKAGTLLLVVMGGWIVWNDVGHPLVRYLAACFPQALSLWGAG